MLLKINKVLLSYNKMESVQNKYIGNKNISCYLAVNK